jgi:hypothetical protein
MNNPKPTDDYFSLITYVMRDKPEFLEILVEGLT